MKNRLHLSFSALLLCIAVTSSIRTARGQDGIFSEDSLIASGFRGANRRVITGYGYTAVRGNFLLPTIRVPGALNFPVANSKPTFYLGTSQNAADDPSSNGIFSEADAGFQWEWETLPFTDDDGIVSTTKPGWAAFVTADTGLRADTPVRERTVGGGFRGWRCGPGTNNPNVTSVDMEWVLERRIDGGVFTGTNGYLRINAIGAVSQPGSTNVREPTGQIYATDAYGRVNFGPGTATMRAKRVVGITQGGSYGGNRFAPGGGTRIPAKLRFPLNGGGNIYDEDGSYMQDCLFSGVTGQDAGQVCFGQTRQGAVPLWENWSSGLNRVDHPSVEVEAERRSGWYPGGKDKQWLDPTTYILGVIPFNFSGTNAPGAVDHFSFPGFPFIRYDREVVNISLRSATPTNGNIVTVGGSSFDSEDEAGGG